jgi:hypothetical protein
MDNSNSSLISFKAPTSSQVTFGIVTKLELKKIKFYPSLIADG